MSTITPDDIDRFVQLHGPLFNAVQESRIFSDSKTFVDAIPKTDPDIIRQKYRNNKTDDDFDLRAFIKTHFRLPESTDTAAPKTSNSMFGHINQLWEHLERKPDNETAKYNTLIPLPKPYIVPGGRFREIYYWDTYFTAEGLAATSKLDMVENMADNFCHLIEQVGHIPNGNRYYYVSRSQPPFLVLLIDLLARYKNEDAIRRFIPYLEKEYQYWMGGSDRIKPGENYRRAVNINGMIVNRYWDDRPLPREESWAEDLETANISGTTDHESFFRNIRAAAESGWDFSSRWLADNKSLTAIQTTRIIPADLNALMFVIETKLAQWTKGDRAQKYRRAAERRKKIYNQLFWDSDHQFYFDYSMKANERTNIWSLAAVYPLFLGLASKKQADAVARKLESTFLKDGGLVTTLHATGQQWDHPNGWAPLQWIAVNGLLKYQHKKLARTITNRWLALNEEVFNRTGKMMEKYNVCDLTLKGGGGEYPLQDGFGWTNGIAFALKKLIDKGQI